MAKKKPGKERLAAAEKRIDTLERAIRGLLVAAVTGYHNHPGTPLMTRNNQIWMASVARAAEAIGVDIGTVEMFSQEVPLHAPPAGSGQEPG